ncbi:hypothetical protein N3K66_003480 [Trichothecium roseum]|uniref:Uncharacterized protein n=1 Tax=Trichothecium roseum TaxID=47278 RepID=A0ACC0V625_9HYPO|nr:hypothetical protein N3K66_003480 [Trichothecium roseum]
MPTEGVWIDPKGRKTFIPLENNPEIFTSLAQDLGVSSDVGFYDVYSLDDPDLLSMVPRPVHALIFITPMPMYNKIRAAEGTPQVDEAGLTYDNAGDDEQVMWFRQTIGNACGLIALLHCIANGEAKNHIVKGSLMDELINQAKPLKAQARADLLYNHEGLEKAHMKAAKTGDTAAPGAEEPDGYGFIAFTRGKDGHLWEMEGSSDGPLDLGELPDDADMLNADALEKGIKRFFNHADGNLEFSIVALANKMD